MKYISILIIFSSCIPQKKIIELCADRYTIKDSIIYIDRYDTVYEFKQAEAVYFWDNKYIYDTIEVKKIKAVNKYIDKVIYRENKAKLELLEIEKRKIIKEKEEVTEKMKKAEYQLKVYKQIRNLIFALLLLSITFYISLKTIFKKWL